MYTWQAALQYCEGLELAGHDDWRLPNVRELQSIVDYGRFSPAIDPAFDAVGAVEMYWSSSYYVGMPDRAWFVSFIAGEVSFVPQDTHWHIRAVRGGLR